MTALLLLLLAAQADRPRLLVTTDIGGDPDDEQSMIRLMLYSEAFEIEGLVATAAGVPGELQEDVVRPDLIRRIVEAYGAVRPNLLLHRPGYPARERLLEGVKSGNPRRGVAHVGEGHDTEGSRWLAAAIERDDARPLDVAVWGGSTDLAQALWRLRNDLAPDAWRAALRRVRVYFIAHQDDTGPWIDREFPELFIVLGKPPEGADKRETVYRGMYLGGDESSTSRAWVESRLLKGHGPLTALYPTLTWTEPNPHGCLKEGDTPSWFFFLPHGLADPVHPEWGGWGGRFRKAGPGRYRDADDTLDGVTHARVSVWRWRPHFQADFEARADWCVRPFAEANHAPEVAINGDRANRPLIVTAPPGTTVTLDASASRDPDADRLTFHSWVYPETGSDAPLEGAGGPVVKLAAPPSGREVHVVAEVRDDGRPPLTSARRVVVRGAP